MPDAPTIDRESNRKVELAEAVALCLESMAFISVLPAAPPFMQPADVVRTELTFSWEPARGVVELVASQTFGACFAANVLGVAVDDPAAAAYSTDAIKELLNALTGSLLRGWGGGHFSLSLPTARAMEPLEWEGFVTSSATTMLDAEGHLIGVRVATRS